MWVAPEFQKYVDRVHDRLIKEGIKLSKEEVTRLIPIMQENNGNGRQTIVVVKESKLRSMRKTHEVEEELYGVLEIPEMRLRK
ncbi:MAG: hypothetical protein Sv326_0447 [Candidatus Fermentimicrarchaeum limneticum]|uniref:Uncharacterized protein n=1 Tax=Fermentimicrarchaeum limneticum TaxID=2795018 RepID=A0A7D6BNK3_FERL1|nr:MAG: hypothetical protein Sv326_0373 [Candidatus Fermentimicrarchaeum limneticum]QLJ52585.1 MAG: hypothetical protein Sv326_0410 [Candidatus Fermentimicrarchaeum limneticum]QLJ52622.1 MAG: hypothetical protein Sv326_0447 [Candidatus Fermentimicrarchaeum limneticum]